MTSTDTLPLQLGSAAAFRCAREFLQQADFNETTLCRLLGMDDMSDLGKVAWDKFPLGPAQASGSPATLNLIPDSLGAPASLPAKENPHAGRDAGTPSAGQAADHAAVNIPPALRWCINIFLRGLIVSEDESQRICGTEVFNSLLELGLLRRAKTGAGVFCPVWLYPAHDFITASDRRDDPEGGPFTPPTDVVFPAIYAGTLRFLRLLPSVAGDALDLCGGSGIGALRLARGARSASTADITERSAFFAEFNGRLNGIVIASLCGDLYEPAKGRQFDLISAHPPFVPATGPNMVYRDAGETGEEVTRRIIEGLPAHLRPGGICAILCVARDTPDKTFEQRACDWLGSAAGEFEIVFGLEKILPVEGVVDSMRKRSQQMSDEEAKSLLNRLRSLGTRQFVYGALLLRRHARLERREPFRIRMTSSATAADFEKLLAWRNHRRQPGFDRWLAGSKPRLAPKLELTARHLVQDGSLVPAEFVFSISNGFEAALRPDAWLVPLVARLEGERSVSEVFEQARTADELPEGFALADFARLVQDLIERGFLEVALS